MESALAAMEARLNARFDGVDQRLDKVDARLDKVDARLDKVDARLEGVDGKLVQLDQTMRVLHEDAMAQFRFSLEAVQGTQESLSRDFAERADSIESTMALIARAVKANREASAT